MLTLGGSDLSVLVQVSLSSIHAFIHVYTDLYEYGITVKPLFIVFVGGLKKKQWIRENNRCGSHS
jgi:hypothetical protein